MRAGHPLPVDLVQHRHDLPGEGVLLRRERLGAAAAAAERPAAAARAREGGAGLALVDLLPLLELLPVPRVGWRLVHPVLRRHQVLPGLRDHRPDAGVPRDVQRELRWLCRGARVLQPLVGRDPPAERAADRRQLRRRAAAAARHGGRGQGPAPSLPLPSL